MLLGNVLMDTEHTQRLLSRVGQTGYNAALGLRLGDVGQILNDEGRAIVHIGDG